MTTATYDVGYGLSRAVYEQAGRHLGMTPGAYRRGGAGDRIRAVVTPTPFGQLLVAATDRGVCRVMLGDDAGALEADLAAEFPRAELAARTPACARTSRRSAGSSPAPRPSPPVDIGGTAFEQQVWRALRAIPYGEVRSYQQVAQAIGRPTAARAVARACGANPVALIVPCHRVVRADGNRRLPLGRRAQGRAAQHERRAARPRGRAGAEDAASDSGRLGGAPRQRAPAGATHEDAFPRRIHRFPAVDPARAGAVLSQEPERRRSRPTRSRSPPPVPQGPGLHRHPAARGLHAARAELHGPQLPPERTEGGHRHRQNPRRRPGRDHRPGPQNDLRDNAPGARIGNTRVVIGAPRSGDPMQSARAPVPEGIPVMDATSIRVLDDRCPIVSLALAMLEITPTLSLDEREIEERFVRASGPGGQNVNKVRRRCSCASTSRRRRCPPRSRRG